LTLALTLAVTRARVALLVLLAATATACGASERADVPTISDGPGREVFLIRISPASFEEMLRIAEVRALATSGGAALLSWSGALPVHAGGTMTPGVDDEIDYTIGASRQRAVVGEAIHDRVERFGSERVLVIVTSLQPTAAMRAAKDELHPAVVAWGDRDQLFATTSSPRALTSDSTRRIGVVTDADVLATISAARGRDADVGQPVAAIDAPPPFELHERYLQVRRMSVPVGIAAGLYVTLGGLFALGVALAAWRGRPSRSLGRIASGIALSVPVLAAALLAVGHLPTLSYATAGPFVAGVTIVVTAAALALVRDDVLRAPVAIAIGVLAFLVVEAALGWTAALTPLLGGSQLDGGRFYGMPNVETGLLLGACLWLAAVMPTRLGVALLVAGGLFAGLPFAGADIGGAVTMFAAAGMWPAVRERRLGWKELAFMVAVVAIGGLLVVLANRSLATTPTHISTVGDEGLGALWRTFVDRLAIGWALIERNPFAIVPVVGVLATLATVLRPPAPFAPSLERRPGWHAALITILLACIVAYVANDTGPAAVGLGFGTALGGLLYVSSADRTWKIGVR
jgi:hypothetical protein